MIDAQSALDAPRTPPRGGSHLDEDQSDQEENDSDDESGDEDDGPAKKKVSRGRRAWTELGTWGRTAMLDSEIDHQILMLANERMEESGLVEWPQARRRDENHYIGLWVRNGEHFRDGGRVSVETYYCPLRNRMDCKVQIRVTRSSTSVCLDTSGGAHTQELCHAQDQSKFLNVKQRLAVAKVCKVNPSATSGDVRRALNRLSPGGKVKKTLSRSVRTVVKIQKRASLASLTDGLEVTNSYASIAALGDRLWFGDILRRRNDDEDDFHFSDPHKVFCIGNVAPESAGEEIFFEYYQHVEYFECGPRPAI